MENNSLKHYGVLGMKWGVRRYQNKDGSLTAAGKKRKRADYVSEAKQMTDQELRSKVNRLNMEKRYMDLSKSSNSKSRSVMNTINKLTSAGSNSGKIANDTEKLRGGSGIKTDHVSKSLDIASKTSKLTNKVANIAEDRRVVKRSRVKLENMSDKELIDAVNRMDMERQYASLRSESISRGKVSADKVLDIAGDVLAIGASATALALSIKQLSK